MQPTVIGDQDLTLSTHCVLALLLSNEVLRLGHWEKCSRIKRLDGDSPIIIRKFLASHHIKSQVVGRGYTSGPRAASTCALACDKWAAVLNIARDTWLLQIRNTERQFLKVPKIMNHMLMDFGFFSYANLHCQLIFKESLSSA